MFSFHPYYPSLLSHCFWCHLYWTSVRVDRQFVFLAYWLQWPSRLFFSLLSLCPCIARLVLEPMDWLTVAPIDPQGRTGIDKLSHNAVPRTFHHLLPSFFTYLVYSYSSSLSALLNLSLASFHPQFPPSPSSFQFICPDVYPSFVPSLSFASIGAIAHRCSRDRCWG